MLILLNHEIIDVRDPVETLLECGVANLRTPPSLAKLAVMGQDLAYASRGLEHAHPDARRKLAAFFGFSGQANCGLFVPPAKARTAKDVAVRFGAAPITTLTHLWSSQQAGVLNAAMINHYVWNAAALSAA